MEPDQLLAWATFTAVLVGPVLAVLVTRFIDARAQSKQRKVELFRALMRTRRVQLDPEHVGALNTLELEFYKDKRVREAFKTYIDHLDSPAPENKIDLERFYDQRRDRFAELLHQIGKVVGYKFDKRDLERLSYVPVAWDDNQILQKQNAILVNSLLRGERPLPVTNHVTAGGNFPPPPVKQE